MVGGSLRSMGRRHVRPARDDYYRVPQQPPRRVDFGHFNSYLRRLPAALAEDAKANSLLDLLVERAKAYATGNQVVCV